MLIASVIGCGVRGYGMLQRKRVAFARKRGRTAFDEINKGVV